MDIKLLFYCCFIQYCAVLLVTCSPLKSESKQLIREKRWARVAKSLHWPEGNVYYKFGCTEFTASEIRDIKVALQGIASRTCINFIEIGDRSTQPDYVNITCTDGGSCRSRLGYQGGAQFLNLARIRFPNAPLRECLSKRKIQHEFLHTLGFGHELNSYNRDEYLDIKYENIENGWENFFAKDEQYKFDSYGCEFDYNSVMMPPSIKHSKNGLPTFVPKDKTYTDETIGVAESVSECDITRINNMYCKKNKSSNQSRLSEY